MDVPVPQLKTKVKRQVRCESRMEWTDEGRIRLVDLADTGEQVVFDCPVAEISRVLYSDPMRGWEGSMALSTPSGIFSLSTSKMWWSPETEAGQRAGEGQIEHYQRLGQMGIGLPHTYWIEQLRAHGVEIQEPSRWKPWVIALGSALLVFAILFVVIEVLP